MSAKTRKEPGHASSKSRGRSARPSYRRKKSGSTGIALAVLTGVAILGALFYLSRGGGGGAKGYQYQVGNPKPGAAAPQIRLASTAGGTFDLASFRGKTVLLYFQEGVMCQPCWTQIKDMEKSMDQFRALGIDEFVSITGDPLDAIRQKVADDGLATPVLADPGLVVSKTYEANQYGMMGTSADGHTFIVVGPDGIVKWRADYGGAPNHYMYIPINTLVAQMRQGIAKA